MSFLKKLTLPPSRKNKAHDEVEALQTKQRKTTNLGEPRNGRMRQADTLRHQIQEIALTHDLKKMAKNTRTKQTHSKTADSRGESKGAR